MDAWLSLEVDKAVDGKKVSRRLTCLIRCLARSLPSS